MLGSNHTSPGMSNTAKRLLGLIALLALVGLGLSLYLTWATWSTSSLAGCQTDGLVDCDHVLTSHWSKWLGIPVSLFGSLVYTSILAACVLVASRFRRIGETSLLCMSLLAAGSAAWFIGLQFFLLQSLCLYCLGVHLCSLAICTLTIFYLKSVSAASNEDQMRDLLGVMEQSPAQNFEQSGSAAGGIKPWIASGLASLSLVVLMCGQILYQPPGIVFEKIESTEPQENESVVSTSSSETNTIEQLQEENQPIELSNSVDPALDETANEVDGDGVARRFIQFAALKKPIDVASLPILGSPKAKQVMVEMLDYTCRHCRHFHPNIHAATERYGDQISFVILHVPLGKSCNPHVRHEHRDHRNACEYARLALNIWKLKREKFAEYHNWLMESDTPPTLGSAKSYALKLAGKEVLLDQDLASESLNKVADNSDDLMALRGGLPMLLTEGGKLQGIPRSEQEWFEFLENELLLTPLE